MNIIFMSSMLGVATFVLRVSTFADNYLITAVTMEDADSYWCKAEYQDNRTSFSDPQSVMLSVSELSLPSLSVTPSTREMLSGENFTIHCPTHETHSADWKLVHFSPDRTEIYIYNSSSSDGIINMPTEHVTQSDEGIYSQTVATPSNTVQYSPLRGALSFAFTAASRTSGLYWCVNAGGRSNAVIITVSYDKIILKTPAFPVFMGDKVVLYCQYQTGNHNETTFFKNGVEIYASTSSSSDAVTEMTIENVTKKDEGLYKCASLDRKLESSESWLLVRPHQGLRIMNKVPLIEGVSHLPSLHINSTSCRVSRKLSSSPM
ncbi:Fc receptor-like A Fc receptor -like protein expressed in B-cells [Channa argus]|uniref:Fc receptor-like A Fc receptor-like protein expressed in B-cells n=1 Tax=Channa argus TaxID=215402 RepID=A0A6G1PLI0_CHAAH|nr:Fc receptor-like A Fc receptor -like protein expressed in B-cells [Channa argus]